MTMEDAAYCAAAWASGEKQKDLAVLFGFKSPVPICVAIRAFLNAYASPEAMALLGVHRWAPPTGDILFDRLIYGDERKSLVPGALRAFQRSRG
jgi:hypothetical protein